MARNQGDFTVVVKRSRRRLADETLPRSLATATEASSPRMPLGWTEMASGSDAVPLRGSSSAGAGGSSSDVRRAAEKLFAPRQSAGPRILPTRAEVARIVSSETDEPAIEAIAAASPEARSPEATEAVPAEPVAQPAPDEGGAGATAPSVARRETRRSERPAFPIGQRWRRHLPESCWPEAVRRSVRRNRRKVIRAAAKNDEPVQ